MTLTAENIPERIDPAVTKAQRMQRLLDASSFGTDDAKEAQLEGARLLSEFSYPVQDDLDGSSRIEEELGRQAETGGDLAAAESHYLSAVRQCKTRPRVMRLALLYLQIGQINRGIPYLISAIDGNTRVGAVFLLSTMIHDAGDDDASELMAGLGRSRLDVRTRCKLDRLDAHSPRRALKMAKDESDGRTLFLSGCSLHLRGNYKDAYLFYSAAMKLRHPMGLIGVGALTRRWKDWADPPPLALPGSDRALKALPTTLLCSEQKERLEGSARDEPDLVSIDSDLGRDRPRVGDGPRDIDRLVADALELRERAVHDLLRIIQPLILSYCRARLGVDDWAGASADDVAQETCLAIIKALPRYQQDSRPFLAFAYGIAAHKVVDAHRRLGRTRSDPVPEVPEVVAPEAGPEERAIRSSSERDAATQVSRLLEQLPDKQREILTLRVMVGLSAEETAEAVSATVGAVRVAQHRALTRLRRLLEAESGVGRSALDSATGQRRSSTVRSSSHPRGKGGGRAAG